ncbi:MAG: GNAT family N-acetyltransferase [Bacteroidota bacterium]|nr:GNAT family N-acetyltransferase [Bacteroidota bacterium]
MNEVNIRKGNINDAFSIYELIKELATYEKAADKMEVPFEQFKADGFGTNPFYYTIVAEFDSKIIGVCLYYNRYSTWKGKRLYIEDIIVTEAHRAKGIGKMLMDATIEEAITTKCNGILWQVLDWNDPAINFYKKYGAWFDDEWINAGLTTSQMQHVMNDRHKEIH